MSLAPVMNLDDFRAEAAVKMVALGDLIDEYGGLIQTGPFGSQLHQRDYTEHGVPVVMPKDIRAGRIDESTVARVSEHKATELARHYLKPRSIVFPRRGEIGKCAYVDRYTERFLWNRMYEDRTSCRDTGTAVCLLLSLFASGS